GHPVEAAVAFADRFPSWRNARPEALAAFGAATASLWGEIAEENGTPWKLGMAEHAATLARALRPVP
ncbi:aminoglycoside phosphotransferase, partial [Streptomyces sp. SID11233]|nr:aminoglycoside phosphotransferase [Streptomyces sp. SID11233]